MNHIHQLFLQAIRAGLKNEQAQWDSGVSPEDWHSLFRLANEHHLLPLFFQAVYSCPAFATADPALVAGVRHSTRTTVMQQTLKTMEFQALFGQLLAAGVTPMVVKGIVCRSLYPMPDHRFSGDEDVLIPKEQYPLCKKVLEANGMAIADQASEKSDAYEIPFKKKNGQLYIELHRSLFPPDSDAYGELNGFFEGANGRAVELQLQGGVIRTLCPTDHMFYLICHAFKHFLHGGFGIRQVCDIVLYANRYGCEMDWPQILENCRAIRAERFAAGLLRIGEDYLVFDPDLACLPECWREIHVDPAPLLRDLLLSGIYGATDMSRKHSSNITLSAVAAQKQGKKARGGAAAALFPKASSLEGRYPYLKDKPWLLPVAWTSRIISYGKRGQSRSNNAADSLRLGNERVELLRQYGIID